jgi:hypothetical protein
VAWIEGDEGLWGLTCDFADVFEGFIFTAVCGCAVGCWPQPVEARYQLFLSGEGEVSCGFRYLKNHPFEAVERKPKPMRRITVIRTPIANVIMLPPWSWLFCVRLAMLDNTGITKPTELSGDTLRLSLQNLIPHRGQWDERRCEDAVFLRQATHLQPTPQCNCPSPD